MLRKTDKTVSAYCGCRPRGSTPSLSACEAELIAMSYQNDHINYIDEVTNKVYRLARRVNHLWMFAHNSPPNLPNLLACNIPESHRLYSLLHCYNFIRVQNFINEIEFIEKYSFGCYNKNVVLTEENRFDTSHPSIFHLNRIHAILQRPTIEEMLLHRWNRSVLYNEFWLAILQESEYLNNGYIKYTPWQFNSKLN